MIVPALGIQERTRSVLSGVTTQSVGTNIVRLMIVPMLRVGMYPVTLRVTFGRGRRNDQRSRTLRALQARTHVFLQRPERRFPMPFVFRQVLRHPAGKQAC